MALWKVQLGRRGEREATCFEQSIVAIGWELGDLSGLKSKEDLEQLYLEHYSEQTPNSVSNQVGQIWTFVSRMQINDWVVCPLKSRSAIAIGVIQSDYEFRKDLGETVQNTRRVKWLKTDLPRTTFDQDLLYSFGAFMTVCKIERNQAEVRVKALVEGKGNQAKVSKAEDISTADTETVGPLDVEQLAEDQIQQLIEQRFKGHKLAQLVDAVLCASGYVTRVSPPGADGGVDILVGAGPMGFDSPNICVQVKSSNAPVDVGVLRELRGTMEAHRAENGLLVSWGGFKSSVLREAVPAYFRIRLWDQGEVLRQILSNYDRLSETLKADLPLKRVWALAVDEESG